MALGPSNSTIIDVYVWLYINVYPSPGLLHPREILIHIPKEACARIFIAELFVIEKIYEQSKSSTGEWENSGSAYNGILYSNEKWTTVACINLDKFQKHNAEIKYKLSKDIWSMRPFIHVDF